MNRDGSCGFWCLLAFEGLVDHCKVRTKEEEKEILRQLELEDHVQAEKRELNNTLTRQDTSSAPRTLVLQPTDHDYANLQEFRLTMIMADASWSQVRHGSSLRSLQCELPISVIFIAIYLL